MPSILIANTISSGIEFDGAAWTSLSIGKLWLEGMKMDVEKKSAGRVQCLCFQTRAASPDQSTISATLSSQAKTA